MRRIWILFLLAIICQASFASPVTPDMARQKAREHFAKQGKQLAAATPSTHRAPRLNAAYYIFNAENAGGFVIVAGDNSAGDLLGYSNQGMLDEENMPPNMREWLNGMAAETALLGNHPIKPRRVQSHEAIGPRISTHWGQGNKNETGSAYNLLCPVIDGNYSPSGCVAVAMAQVMNYYQWPQEACAEIPGYENTGATLTLDTLPQLDFNWHAMLSEYAGGESEDEQLAVAQLMRYCGQAALTSYYPDKALAYADNAAIALPTYFGYSSSISHVKRDNYSEEEWDQLIYNELAISRPVIYFGENDDSSHAFICDGYDGDEFYHINWGWGGLCDGYFKLSILTPDYNEEGLEGEAGKTYSKQQHAIIGITPNSHSAKVLTFSDEVVKTICVSRWDVDGDGELSYVEAASILSLDNAFRHNLDITEFSELQYFTGLTGIAPEAFESCRNLTNITIPKNVETIGQGAFRQCPLLQNISVVEDNPFFDSREDCNALIETATSTLVWGCAQSVIPQSVTALGNGAFEDCVDLTEIILPDQLTSIGDRCFAGCVGIESLYLPNSLGYIGQQAFADCVNLGTIIIDQLTPPTTAADAFEGCTAIVYVPKGAKAAYLASEGWSNLIIEEPQDDNYIYCQDVDFRRPLGAKIIVGLSNKAQAIGLQFQIYLPEGVSISTYERGKTKVEVTDRAAGHQVHCTRQEDGSYIILLMSMTLETISDNEGPLLIIPLEANDSITEGDYEIRFDNITISTIDENEDIYGVYPAPFTCQMKLRDYLLGDVDHDRHINVSDVMMVVNYVLGKRLASFYEEEADIDENNRVDIVDVMRVVQVVIRRPSDAYAPSTRMDATALLETEDEGLYTLHLDNPSRYTAMQLCVEVADGCDVTDIHLDESMGDRHQVSYEPLDDGRYSIVVYSLDGRPFSDADTKLLHIATDGSPVTISNVLLTTSDFQTVGTDHVTRITPHITEAGDSHTPTYNLAGQRVSSEYKGLVVKKGKTIFRSR